MPELPEVETIVNDLKRKVLKRTFLGVWTDFAKMIKIPKSFSQFQKELKEKEIQKVWRRGKNIIFDLSDDYCLRVHQKMTGHLLFGKWQKQKGKWQAVVSGPLKEDPWNRFLHLVFQLDNGYQLALSDMRKFAKVDLRKKEDLLNSPEFKELGPEPLEKGFTFTKFKERLQKKKKAAEGEPRQRRGKIKQILMDQSIIVGIGNIYSDEILWQAKIHPFRPVVQLNNNDFKRMWLATRQILKKAIKLRGTSIPDFRDTSGKPGGYDKARLVYRREGEKCQRCKTKIKRIKMGGRSAHFCPKCQPLTKTG